MLSYSAQINLAIQEKMATLAQILQKAHWHNSAN